MKTPSMVENETEHSDADLVARAASGMDAAFTTLFHRYYERVRCFAFRIVLEAQAADDVAQETFIRAARHLSSIREGQAFLAWLFRIAANVARDHLRSQRAHDRKLESAAATAAVNQPDSGASADQAQRAFAAMQALPPKQRAAVALVFIENCSHSEAAQRLGCAESTVSWRIFLAKRTLRKWLTQ